MRTIRKNVSGEIIIKNSRFIALLFKINNPEIEGIINEIRNLYSKATHYCYAYICNDIKHFSDDGEPGGTAGMPILNVLDKEELNNVLCVVVRYFGGIKLGAGGLVRAYTKAVTEVLKKANFLYLERGLKIEIIFDYEMEKQINYLLKDSIVIDKSYDEKIKYTVLMEKNNIERLYNYNYQILEEVFIEKEKN